MTEEEIRHVLETAGESFQDDAQSDGASIGKAFKKILDRMKKIKEEQ